ncbi:MAG: hypothetical protein Q9209_006445 [Squamulea sp. 1 TL-2023]
MQGFNMGRYVPPDQEGITSANKLAGKYGILTVRFEMPYAIWCSHCPKPTIIGQGVRFNAEKKKVGNYHSTPIFSFRMKHNVCGGWIEIRTDPKNTAYVVVEGATKRETGDDVVKEGDYVIQSQEEKEKMQNDAFAALEGRVEEKKQVFSDKSRIEELYRGKERDWDDPYQASKRLRKTFRVERKVREQEEKRTEDLKERMSLGMELVPENEDDKRKAGFVDFGVEDAETAVNKATSKPLFGSALALESATVRGKPIKKANVHDSTQDRLKRLQSELGNNSRAALDPFLNTARPVPSAVPLIKRKGNVPETTPLVDYESDST